MADRVVGIWGWGTEGRVAAARLEALGVRPVIVADDARQPGVIPFDAGGAAALARCEVVIKSPGISRHRYDVKSLEARGVQVVGGLGLWMEDADLLRVCCVTGTKGKSTTVSIAGHLVAGLGQRPFVGGNLGMPPYAPEAPKDIDWWLVETSSYQCTDLWTAPAVVAVTSLYPDHLDWHGSLSTYYDDKLSICRLPGARLTVANEDDHELHRRADKLGPEVQWVGMPSPGDPPPPWVRSLGAVGPHNVRNAMIARACLMAMGVPGADDDDRVEKAAAGFHPLPGRLTKVATADGVDFIDDGLSTNVGSTLAALETFPERRLALIVGGFDRGIDYEPLARALVARPGTMVLTVPDVGDRIADEIARAAADSRRPILIRCADETEATLIGFDWVRPGGVVLLSPAAPSYGRYQDYRERSAAFAAAAALCQGA